MSGDRHGDTVAFARVRAQHVPPLDELIPSPSLQSYPPSKVSLRRSQVSAFQHLNISHRGLPREEEVANILTGFSPIMCSTKDCETLKGRSMACVRSPRHMRGCASTVRFAKVSNKV